MGKLSPMQARFAQEYLVDLNATQAAIRAGYSEKTAASQGERLLRNVEIAAAVQSGFKEMSEKTEITAERVLMELAKIAFAEADVRDADKLKALELTGRHLGMFTDKVKQEVSGPEGAPLITAIEIELVRPKRND